MEEPMIVAASQELAVLLGSYPEAWVTFSGQRVPEACYRNWDSIIPILHFFKDPQDIFS